MTNIISRTLRSCVKNCSTIDEVSIRNMIESAMDNLKHAKVVNTYACEKIIIHKRGTLFSWEKDDSVLKKIPGDLFFDSDGKISGLVISSYDDKLFVLRDGHDFAFVSIDVQVSIENYVDRNIHVEEQLR